MKIYVETEEDEKRLRKMARAFNAGAATVSFPGPTIGGHTEYNLQEFRDNLKKAEARADKAEKRVEELKKELLPCGAPRGHCTACPVIIDHSGKPCPMRTVEGRNKSIPKSSDIGSLTSRVKRLESVASKIAGVLKKTAKGES